MPRIRSIKPEFWSDRKMALKLSRDVRLFYVSLWNHADDEGRFNATTSVVKGATFPHDEDIHGSVIELYMSALVHTHRLVLYELDGERWGWLPHFLKHQRINRPTPSRIPAPPNDLTNAHGWLTEAAPTPQEAPSSVVWSREVEQGTEDLGAGRMETGHLGSPATKADDREQSIRAPVSQTTLRSIEELKAYLGEQAFVVDSMLEVLPPSEQMQVFLAVKARWLPGGGMYADWGDTPEDRRPEVLAVALADYPWAMKVENGGINLRHLRGFLTTVVRGDHRQQTDGGWEWLET